MDDLYLRRMEELVRIDINDALIRNKMLLELEGENIFNLEKYMEYYEYFGEIGKTQLEIWKSDETLKRFYKGIGFVLAVGKFRRGLRKE